MGNGFAALSQLVDTPPSDVNTSELLVTFDENLAPQTDEVVSRELLDEGFLCSLALPKNIVKKVLPNGVTYEQFGVPVDGGWLNFHLFDRQNCVMRGKRVWVECKMFKKEMADGRIFLYVDLLPTENRPTYDRKIWQHSSDVPTDLPAGTKTFACYGDTKGVLGFVPREVSQD